MSGPFSTQWNPSDRHPSITAAESFPSDTR
jgi:hypothetical protein